MMPNQRPWWYELAAGGLSGAAAKTVTAPMQRVVILQQLRRVEHRGAFAALRDVVDRQGVASLWRGNLVTVLHRFPYSGLSFMLYESSKRSLLRLRRGGTGGGITALERAVAGCGAGCGAVLATYPLDTLRTHLAASTSTQRVGIQQTLQEVVAAHGVRGLYKGVTVAVGQKVPELSVQLCVYETAKARLEEVALPTPVRVVASACLSGLSSLLFYPCDVVRRNMQVAACARDASAVAAAAALMRAGGPAALFRGAHTELLRTIPFVVVMWAALETFRTAGDGFFAGQQGRPATVSSAESR